MSQAEVASDSDSDQVCKNTKLFTAINKKGNTEDKICAKVEKHLKQGANINAVDKNRKCNTVLHIAVKKKYYKVIEFLLSKGAKICVENEDRKKALDLAKEQQDEDAIKILIKSINIPADGNCLFWAVALAYLTSVKMTEVNLMRDRYIKLFGQDELLNFHQVQGLIQMYNPFISQQNILEEQILKRLVTQKFREKVVDYMRKKAVLKLSITDDIKQYLSNMSDCGVWGGEHEIEAMSQMLECTIQVHSTYNPKYGPGIPLIDLYHESLKEDRSSSNNRNHYNFGVDANVIDSYRREQMSDASLISQSLQIKRNAEDVGGRVIKKIKLDECKSKNLVDAKRHLSGKDSDAVMSIKNKRNPFENESKEEYSSSEGLKNSLHGNIYQLKLLILFLQRGLKKRYSFRLATEMDVAEKFDDLVFQYAKKDDTGTVMKDCEGNEEFVYRFLQAKHKQDESSMITYNDLCTENIKGEFSLLKYFDSYRKIKQKPEFSKGEIKDIILCTNINFNFDQLDEKGIVVNEMKEFDDFLDFKYVEKSAARYKLCVNDKHELYDKLKKTSDLHKLCKELFKRIKNQTELNLTSQILRAYHVALVLENVIVIEKKEGKRLGKFNEAFIKYNFRDPNDPSNDSGLSETAVKLRRILDEYLVKSKDLLIKELILSSTFGKGFVLNPQLTDINDFTQELISLLRCAQTDNVVEVERRKRVIRDNVDKLAGHVLVEKDQKVQFSSKFLDVSKKLVGNLEDFRKKLKNELGKEYETLERFQFKIKDFFTCKELPQDYIENEEISDFFIKLVFAVNQPNEVELGKLLAGELGEECNLIDSDFVADYIQKQMLDWFKAKGTEKGREGAYLATEDGNELLSKTKQKIALMILVSSKLEYCAKIKTFGIEFAQHIIDNLRSLRNFLISENNKQIFHLATEHNTLSAIKLYQVLRNIGKYKKDDSYIFKSLKFLLLIKHRIIQAFQSKTCNLLIIECREDEYQYIKEIDIEEICEQLCSIIKVNANKKIVLIAKECDALSVWFKNSFNNYEANKDDQLKFTNLTYGSQNKLLKEVKIVLHERERSLNDLIDERSKELIDSEMLEKLINEKDIKLGNELVFSSGYNKDYYIHRTFSRHIEIKPTIFKAKDNFDLLAISGIDKAALCSLAKLEGQEIRLFNEQDLSRSKPIRFIVLDIEREKEQFQELCKSYSSRNIHWLKSKKLVWQQSRGSVSGLVQFKNLDNDNSNSKCIINYSENKLLKRELLCRKEHKVVIISDTAGMGKSTVLTELIKQITQVFPTPLFVVRIDLNKYTKVLENVKKQIYFNKESIDLLINFLLETLFESHEQSRIKSDFEKQLISSSLKEEKSKIKVALLFDAFDEISPKYKDMVIDLLYAMLGKLQVEKLFITTRLNIGKDLEMELGVFAYNLDSFSEGNQVEFLIKFWKKNLNLDDGERLANYAQSLIDKFGKSISDREKEFTGIPLQLRMIAEVFQENEFKGEDLWQGCKEFVAACNNEIREPKLPKKFKLLDLYNRFVKKKFYNLYLEEKKGIDFSQEGLDYFDDEKFRRKYQTLALHRLLSDEDFQRISSEEEEQWLDDFITEIENAKENVGIIDQIIDNKAHFIHLTYAEYFASFALIQGKFSAENSKKVFICINSIMANASPVFLDSVIQLLKEKSIELTYLLDGKTLLNFAALEGYLNLVKALLEDGYVDFPTADAQSKTPLHYAAEHSHLHIVKYLLSYHNDIFEDEILEHGHFKNEEYEHSKLVKFVNEKDKDCKTAVYYAAKANYLKIACYLLLKGADSDALEDYIQPVALYVTGETHGAYAHQYHKLRPLEEKLLLQFPYVVSHFNEWYEYPRLLSYFFAHGRVQVVDTLIRSIEDEEKRKRLLNAIDNGFTPLDRVNLSNKLSDDDRLAITKYLVENGGGRSQRTIGWSSGCYIKKILQAAAGHGHIKTFKHFISQEDPDQYHLPLYTAAQYQQLNIIQYLLENHQGIVDENENTGLHFAVHSGANLKIVKCFLDQEDVNAANVRGETPLFQAIYASRGVNVIKYLVDHGADVNIVDNEGNTPLYYAIKNDQTDTIKYLILECEADINGTCELMRPNTPFIRTFNEFDLNCEDEINFLRLHFAIQSGDLEWSKFLIRQGDDVNNKDRQGKTPLHWACELEHVKIVELLLQYGARYNEADVNNKTPIDLVPMPEEDLYQNGQQIIWLLYVLDELFSSQNLMRDLNELLIGGKAGERLKDWGPYEVGIPDAYDGDNPTIFILNARNAQERSLLHIAAETKDGQALDILLQFNDHYSRLKAITSYPKFPRYKDFRPISINTIDFEGNTPLLLAARNGHHEFITKLLEYGAIFDPGTLEENNHKKSEAITKLVQTTRNLFTAVDESDLIGVKASVSEGAYINAFKRECGKSALHCVATSGNTEIAQFLLSLGANTEAVDSCKRTPLHLATKSDKIEMVKLLFKHGAIFNAKDEHGKTPFDLNELNDSVSLVKAVTNLFSDVQSDEPQVVIKHLEKVLKEYEVDVNSIINIRDDLGHSILHYEDESRYCDVAGYVLENGLIFNVRNKLEKDFEKQKEAIVLLKKIDYLFANVGDVGRKAKQISSEIIMNVGSDFGMMMLREAVRCGDDEMGKWLVDCGVSVEAKDNNGDTVLHCAAECGHLDVFHWLVGERKVETNVENYDGKTPLDLAVGRNHKRIIDDLNKINDSKR